MLYQELRPYRFDDMVGQRYIVENVREQAKRDAWFHSFILAGQFGSGKTTTARMIAMAANCMHKDANGNPCGECETCAAILNGQAFDFKEIDGASNTGVDNIRELKEYVSYRPVQFKKKVVIIDEVHKLSDSAFNSLLKVLEEPPEYVIFILCTTKVDAIPDTVQSRCAVYRFSAIPEKEIAEYLLEVSRYNGFQITEGAALMIAKYSSGAMRNALKYLEQLASSGGSVNEDLVVTILGVADTDMMFDLLSIYMEQRVDMLPEYMERLQRAGRDQISFMKEVERACADVILCAESGIHMVIGTEGYRERVQDLASRYSSAALCHLSSELNVMSSALRTDGTAASFFIHSVSLIQRMKDKILDQEAILKDMNSLRNQLTDLRVLVGKLMQGVVPVSVANVAAPEAASLEADGTNEYPEPETPVAGDDTAMEPSDPGCYDPESGSVDVTGVMEEGFGFAFDEDVPFEETASVPCDTPSVEPDRQEVSAEETEDDFGFFDDDFFEELCEGTFSEQPKPLPVAPASSRFKRGMETGAVPCSDRAEENEDAAVEQAPTAMCEDDTDAGSFSFVLQEEAPVRPVAEPVPIGGSLPTPRPAASPISRASATPIPRGASAPIPRNQGSYGQMPVSEQKTVSVSAQGKGLSAESEGLRMKMLELVKGDAGLTDILTNHCKYEDRNGHLRVTCNVFQYTSMVLMLINRNKMNRVEVEYDQNVKF